MTLCLQVIVVYQLSFNGEKHARACEARTFITHCIGCWQAAWRVSYTQGRVPMVSDTDKQAELQKLLQRGATAASAGHPRDAHPPAATSES